MDRYRRLDPIQIMPAEQGLSVCYHFCGELVIEPLIGWALCEVHDPNWKDDGGSPENIVCPVYLLAHAQPDVLDAGDDSVCRIFGFIRANERPEEQPWFGDFEEHVAKWTVESAVERTIYREKHASGGSKPPKEG